MRKTASLLLIAPLLFLSGCWIAPVYRPEISTVVAQKAAAPAASAVVFNFKLMDTLKGEGPMLANYAAGALARDGFAEAVDRVDVFVADNREAARLAKERGSEVAVFGTIDDFIYGGLTTESKATVSLFAVEAETGKVLWRVSGTMSEPPKKPEEKFFYLDNGSPAPMPMKLSIMVVSDISRAMTGKPSSSEPQEPPKPKYGVAPRDGGGWRTR